MTDLTLLNHRPARAPRASFLGECALATAWEALMTTELPRDDGVAEAQHLLDRILVSYPHRTSQREATVAASIVSWFGSNCGRSFLRCAHDLAQALPATTHGLRANAYRMQWAIENARDHAVNSGATVADAILSPWDASPRQMLGAASARDLEVIDHLMAWLPSYEAQTFLDEAFLALRRDTLAHEIASLDSQQHPGVEQRWRSRLDAIVAAKPSWVDLERGVLV